MSKYNLHQLGWKNFENLCGHIMQNVLGPTYTPFSEGRDGGRDGFFEGIGNLEDLSLSGKFVFQCKFTSTEIKSITIKELEDELPKIRRLIKKEDVQHYIIFTNYKLSAENDLKIKEFFKSMDGLESCTVLGDEWIEMTLDENKSLRKMVPRLYGIGDLSEILDDRVYQQSVEVIEELKENVTSFVITKSYRNAVNAVTRKGFVLLLGQPASGKTTIATNIAMTSLIEDQLTETLILEEPNQFRIHWNPYNSNQLFWFDDVFGATNLDHSLVRDWQKVFPKLRAAINKGAKVIFTSRDYIFNEAKEKFKENSFPLLFDSQVVINVQELNLSERQQILYNHIKSGDLLKVRKSELKPYLSNLSKNPDFSPELARRLGNDLFHNKLSLDKNSLNNFFSHPSSFFEGVINNLHNDKKAAMILILIHNNQLISPVQQTQLDKNLAVSFNVSLPDIKEALETMKNSLVKLNVVSSERYWSLYHPSMIDSLHQLLSNKEEMLDLYIRTADIDTIVRDTTFMEKENKVTITRNLWGEVTQRICSFLHTKKVNMQERVAGYLLNEATDNYLYWLSKNNKNVLKELIHEPSFFQFEFVSTYKFAFRLNELSIMEDNWKLSLRIQISKIAMNDCDLSFLRNKYIMSFIDDKTKSEIVKELLSEGPDYLYDVFDNLKDNIDDELDREEIEYYFDNWIYTVNYLIGILKGENFECYAKDYQELVDQVESEIDDLKDEKSEDNEGANTSYMDYKEISIKGTNDIFSDVDK